MMPVMEREEWRKILIPIASLKVIQRTSLRKTLAKSLMQPDTGTAQIHKCNECFCVIFAYTVDARLHRF